jgi:hypothetical protein
MNIDSLNKRLTLIANIGVLFGIAFLIVELDQNTTAIETEAIWSRMEMASSIQQTIIEGPGAYLLGKYGNVSLEEAIELVNNSGPVDDDVFRITTWYQWMMLYWEARFLTLNSDGDRSSLKGNILNNFSPLGRVVFSSPSYLEALHPEFREYLLQLISEYELSQ